MGTYRGEAEKNKTILCAVYTRKSTDENLNAQFTSIDSQREYCEAFIKSREPEGWRVCPETYSDPGFSGGNLDRPGIKKLLVDARHQKFNVVVCYKYDRLTRNTKDFLQILEIFERCGIHFVSVTQPIDTTSPVGRLMRSILMEFAQFEREMISERTRDKLAAMARKGKRTGGFPIIGYDIDKEKKSLVINPDEAVAVQEMFDGYLRTRSLWATAKILDGKGYRVKEWTTHKGRRKGGGRFNRTNLWYLLRNPLYIGKITFRGQALPGEHPGIIPEDIFNKVQEVMNGNGKGRRNKMVESLKHAYILRGLIRCASCGQAMTPHGVLKKNKLRFFYYRCVSVAKMDRNACAVRSVPAQAIEDFVLKRLGLLSSDEKLIKEIVKKAKVSAEVELPVKRKQRSYFTAEIGKIDAEARNLVSMLGEQGADCPKRTFYEARLDELAARKPEFGEKLALLDKEILELERQEIDAEAVRRYMRNFLTLYEKLGQVEKKEMLCRLVKQVILDGEKSRVRITLKPLPEVWGDLDYLEDRFVYCQSWLPD
ncbi:MAG: recombinase family protein [Elusimicrobia bacterium]|nr:recombinase family protein [Elusimicrobiota bacterium]